MGTEPSRGHLPINGLNLYHEVYGDLGASKPPLLLIPSAFMATDSMKVWTDRLRGGGDEEAAATGVLQYVPTARLVVLPAMSHIGLAGESELLMPMVSAFLDDVPPTTPELF